MCKLFCPNQQRSSEPFKCLDQRGQDEAERWDRQADRQTVQMKRDCVDALGQRRN